MAKKLMSALAAVILGLSATAQKTALEYLDNAPIKLGKEVCAFTKEEFEHFADHLKSYCDTLREDIEQRKQSSRMVELSAANYQKAMEILGKVTDYSSRYMSQYYCLTLLCKDYPELLSGEEISKATGYSGKFKDFIQFRLDVTTGKAKESDRPGWRKESLEAETGFCEIMGPKYLKVLENDLTELRRFLPDYLTLSSLYYTDKSGSEIEALSAVHNYLEKFRTNSFLGNLKIVFSDFSGSSSGY